MTARFFESLKTAGKAYSDDKVPMMGAALAYYTAFAIAPLLVIALGAVGVFFGTDGERKIFGAISGMVGANGASAIEGMVRGALQHPQGGRIATLIGTVTLVAGALGVFCQLQESLNLIWKVTTRPRAGVWSTMRLRLFSFGMVGVIAFLLLVSLLASAGIAAAGNAVSGLLTGGAWLWRGFDFTLSVALTTVLFAAIFKVLPDAEISWSEGLVGGLFTAVLFTIGKSVIGAYLGRSGVASAYGAAGSLIVVLLWVFYNSQLVLFGAEFARAYSARAGRPVPREGTR